MSNATLKMQGGDDCWDQLVLILRKNFSLSSLLHLNNRNSALEVYRQLAIAHFEGHADELTVDIDGGLYLMSYQQWQAVLSCLDQWFEDYMSNECPDV